MIKSKNVVVRLIVHTNVIQRIALYQLQSEPRKRHCVICHIAVYISVWTIIKEHDVSFRCHVVLGPSSQWRHSTCADSLGRLCLPRPSQRTEPRQRPLHVTRQHGGRRLLQLGANLINWATTCPVPECKHRRWQRICHPCNLVRPATGGILGKTAKDRNTGTICDYVSSGLLSEQGAICKNIRRRVNVYSSQNRDANRPLFVQMYILAGHPKNTYIIFKFQTWQYPSK